MTSSLRLSDYYNLLNSIKLGKNVLLSNLINISSFSNLEFSSIMYRLWDLVSFENKGFEVLLIGSYICSTVKRFALREGISWR